MEKELIESRPPEKSDNTYLIATVVLTLGLPLISMIIDLFGKSTTLGWPLIGKWFVFWAIGVRLFIVGIKQATDPSFTASKIFNIKGSESYAIIRELGFANLCAGLVGILSIGNVEWRPVVAIVGGLYFGLAGIQHLVRNPQTRNEAIATISDLFIFLISLMYVVAVLL